MPAPPQGAASLLASLPATLGRPPGPAELILLGWSDYDDEHVATVTLDLSEVEPRAELDAVRQLVIDGATYAAAVVCVPREEVAVPTGRFLGACAARFGLDLRDAIAVYPSHVHGVSVWRSIGCPDPTCCPPEGRQLPTPTTDQENQ